MAPRVFSTNEVWNAYGHWIIDNGGYIHPSLTFHAPSNYSH
jgi:hypothetical protein